MLLVAVLALGARHDGTCQPALHRLAVLLVLLLLHLPQLAHNIRETLLQRLHPRQHQPAHPVSVVVGLACRARLVHRRHKCHLRRKTARQSDTCVECAIVARQRGAHRRLRQHLRVHIRARVK